MHQVSTHKTPMAHPGIIVSPKLNHVTGTNAFARPPVKTCLHSAISEAGTLMMLVTPLFKFKFTKEAAGLILPIPLTQFLILIQLNSICVSLPLLISFYLVLQPSCLPFPLPSPQVNRSWDWIGLTLVLTILGDFDVSDIFSMNRLLSPSVRFSCIHS